MSLCCYSVSFLQAQVTTDSNFVGEFNSPQTNPATISNFTVPSGDNRVLIVAVGSFGDNFPTSVSYGGMPMTQAVLESDFLEASIWYIALGSGAAIGPSDIVANTGLGIAAVSFQNVNQTSSFANPTQDSGDASSSSLSVPTTDVKNLVVDVFFANTGTYTASHTEIGKNPVICMGSAVGTGGNVNVEWSKEQSGTTGGHGHVAIELIGLEATTPPASIPTLSQWGLIILALLLMTLGTLHLVQPMVTTKEA